MLAMIRRVIKKRRRVSIQSRLQQVTDEQDEQRRMRHAIRLIRFNSLTYGLQLFPSGSRCAAVTCALVSKLYYLLLLMGLGYSIFAFASVPGYKEDAVLVIVILVVSVSIYSFLRRNVSAIEEVIAGAGKYLTPADLDHVRRTDSWIMGFHLLTSAASLACAALAGYFGCNVVRREAESMPFFKQNSVVYIYLSLGIGILFYLKFIYGVIVCSIQVYVITHTILGCLAHQVREAVRAPLTRRAVDVASLSRVRFCLRSYWHWKGKADAVLNVFPFCWASFLFLSSSLMLSKVIADWGDASEPRTFLFVSLFFAILVLLSLTTTWHLMTEADKTMQDCVHLAFRVTDPRLVVPAATPAAAAEVRREILCLHMELANAPDTHATLLGSVRLDFATLISFAAGLVNFSVMIINIRSAVKA